MRPKATPEIHVPEAVLEAYRRGRDESKAYGYKAPETRGLTAALQQLVDEVLGDVALTEAKDKLFEVVQAAEDQALDDRNADRDTEEIVKAALRSVGVLGGSGD